MYKPPHGKPSPAYYIPAPPIRYDVYRCLAQLAGLQDILACYGRSMPVNIMPTSRKWSAL